MGGHTIEVHLESYSRSIPDGTADLNAKKIRPLKLQTDCQDLHFSSEASGNKYVIGHEY